MGRMNTIERKALPVYPNPEGYGPDGSGLACGCGNDDSGPGFTECDEFGEDMVDHGADTVFLAKWPGLYRCDGCGRILLGESKGEPTMQWNAPFAKPVIRLGRVQMTPGARAALDRLVEAKVRMSDGAWPESAQELLGDLLIRHVTGDWGDCDAEDFATSTAAAENGERVMSSYYGRTSGDGDVIWIITEWDRSLTTILEPGEY